MPIINTSTLTPELIRSLPSNTVRQIYNSLDCCITVEVLEQLQSLSNSTSIIYDFERALQAPVLEMMLRGFKIDQYERQKGIKLLTGQMAYLDSRLQEMAYAVWDKPLNPRSPKQLIDFFYGRMRLPEQWKNDKGKRRLSTDREALEKLDLYFYARPIVSTILEIRNIGKQLSVLETEIDADGRMRTSYNIAGTETGRWSSSSNAFGTGTNLQNIAPNLRNIFIADRGYKLYGIDLEQAESREVGWQCGVLFDDWTYLDACYSGDLHTLTCRLIWPDLAWTGDGKADRAIADQNFYRNYSRRDMSKRGGHGCLTEDHEVLTPYGWEPITDKPMQIMTWHPTKGSQFDLVQKWTDFLYTGEMHRFEGNSVDCLMTDDHRVPFYSDIRYPLKERRAKEGPHGQMPLGSDYIGGDEEVPARLIAAFMADGHQKSANRMEFHFHKERKKKRLVTLCREYEYFYEDKGDKILVHGCLPKVLGSYMFNWTKKCLQDFLDEIKHWDGHIGATAVSIHSSKREQLEWIQTFGRILGIGGQIQKPRISGFGTIMYTLQQNNRKFASAVSMQWKRGNVLDTRVLCPTVPSGWFYVRRNGKIFITGNSNYYGTPFTMARHLKVPTKLMEDFQRNYFGAFPAIQRWHRYTAQQLQQNQLLKTPWGRSRHFFGRPNDDSTLREAIAFVPQSSTGDRMNLGLFRIWKSMRDRVQLIAQVHDAVYFQAPEHLDEQEIAQEALNLIDIRLEHNGHTLIVPGEVKTGWNWANWEPKITPNGMKKIKKGVKDERVRV